MKTYDNIIIGFGKAGKTLAGTLAGLGQSVVLVEQDPDMYGGACINVACIPTKSLEHSARLSAAKGGDFAQKAARYTAAVAEKRRLTEALRQKNYDKALSAGVTVMTGTAAFLDEHRIAVTHPDGTAEELTGERIFLNTGARPFFPTIEGLDSPLVYTSQTLMEREDLPRRLAIVGGGYIGLEFASYFANFGSQVTVIQDGRAFIPREDEEIAHEVWESLTRRGIQILREVKIRQVRTVGQEAVLILATARGEEALTADAVLVATGRRPNVEGLNLEKAGVKFNPRGGVETDAQLRTSVPHIWAMGDVVGGLQFTYISLDDFRIVKSALLGDGSRTTENRGAVPYTVFLDPPLSRVGLSEAEARQAGYQVGVATLPAAAIPKANVLQQTTGLLKVLVDKKTDLILGAHLFCAESHEMINLIKLAMDAKLPYTWLRDGIFNHPTMSEAFNDLFASLR